MTERPDPSNEAPRKRELSTVVILVLLALTGAIPWIGILRGEPPAYSAEIGAVVFVLALALLVPTVWELRRDRRSSDGRRDD